MGWHDDPHNDVTTPYHTLRTVGDDVSTTHEDMIIATDELEVKLRFIRPDENTPIGGRSN